MPGHGAGGPVASALGWIELEHSRQPPHPFYTARIGCWSEGMTMKIGVSSELGKIELEVNCWYTVSHLKSMIQDKFSTYT